MNSVNSSSTNGIASEFAHAASISFVIPCLNEEQSLPHVLERIECARNLLPDRDIEVIVSDNGSTDQSVAIAERYGARVLHCAEKGYGAALNHGIRGARNDVVIFADADNTYDFAEAPKLIEKISSGYDLVIGTRLKGEIRKGAMPILHRYVGTPVLNLLINSLYGDPKQKISDCNSGFRCFTKQQFEKWSIQSRGMEFASEMIVKAMKSQARIAEVPITLERDLRNRVPHLKTWRDGMRHLMQILLESPKFFASIGSATFLLCWTMLLVGLVRGEVALAGFTVFGLHSMMFAMLGTLLGLAIWGVGLLLAVRKGADIPVYTFLINLREDYLFWSAVALGIFSIFSFSLIVAQWQQNHFMYLALHEKTLALITLCANGLFFFTHVFTAHLLKRI